VRLEGGLVVGLHPALLGELGVHVLGGLFELLGGVGGLLGPVHGVVLGQVGLGPLLLHPGVIDLLRRVRGDVLEVLRHVLGRRLEIALLLGEVLGVRVLRVRVLLVRVGILVRVRVLRRPVGVLGVGVVVLGVRVLGVLVRLRRVGGLLGVGGDV